MLTPCLSQDIACVSTNLRHGVSGKIKPKKTLETAKIKIQR